MQFKSVTRGNQNSPESETTLSLVRFPIFPNFETRSFLLFIRPKTNVQGRKIRRGAIKGGIRYISRWTESCTRYRNYAIPEQPSIYPRIVSILDGDPSVFGSPVWTIGQCSFSVQLFPITGRCVHEGKIGFDSWEDRWYWEEIEFRKKLSVVSCTKFKI